MTTKLTVTAKQAHDDEEASGEFADIDDAHEEASPAMNTRALHRKYKIRSHQAPPGYFVQVMKKSAAIKAQR